jgi:hypothetical protein
MVFLEKAFFNKKLMETLESIINTEPQNFSQEFKLKPILIKYKLNFFLI